METPWNSAWMLRTTLRDKAVVCYCDNSRRKRDAKLEICAEGKRFLVKVSSQFASEV
jgi:hypothetical protein